MDSARLEPPEGFSLDGAAHGRRPEEDVAHRKALRLTFSYRGSRVRLILMEAIDMIVPPSLEITSQPPGEFWYELQDGKQTPLYRRTQRNPLRPSVEVQTGNPERPLANIDSGRTEGQFVILVPSLTQARSAVLYVWSLPRDASDRDLSAPPSEIARFPLGRAVDKATLARDNIAPMTVSDALAAYDRAATIHLRASDNTGQVASTHYRLDDGDARRGVVVNTAEPGDHTLLFWSVDRAGNVEPENRVTFTVHPRARRGKS